MDVEQCWIAYCIYHATGEGMHYAISIAQSAERATQLFEEHVNELFRGNSTTALLLETLERYPAVREVIPEEILQRTSDPLCWTLEYFGAIDFNCG